MEIKTGMKNGLFAVEEFLNAEETEKAEAILKLLDGMKITSACELLETVKSMLLDSVFTV